MMRDFDKDLFHWELHGSGDDPTAKAAAAQRLAALQLERDEQLERNAKLAATYTREDGTTGNVASLIPEIYEHNRQVELKFPSMTKRSIVRLVLADAIERKVLPLTNEQWCWDLPARLRDARQDFCLGFRPSDGKRRIAWDKKAGLSRVCPDDAREDAMRMQRRVIEPLLAMKKNGRQITYCVFTLPNYQPGSLRTGIKAIYRRFGALLRKRQGGELKWRSIEAAMCVLEAPLARDRTWNVHLNVMLVHRGFIDYGELRKDWGGWNVDFQRVIGGREQIERSLREIIKYSARAVAEKSQCPRETTPVSSGEGISTGCASVTSSDSGTAQPASDVSGRFEASQVPPAMVDWTGEELLEWLKAFRGFRRTRTYRALYRLEKPPKDSMSGYLWVGQGRWVNSGWQLTVGPLDSIPGDKSTTPDALERWNRWLSRLVPQPRPPPRREKSA
jgi:hypothetical protein